MKVSATGVYNGFRYIEAPESGLLVLVAQQIRAGKHFTGQPLVASAFIDSTPQVGVLLSLRNRAYALRTVGFHAMPLRFVLSECLEIRAVMC